jgi:hypothetical protein
VSDRAFINLAFKGKPEGPALEFGAFGDTVLDSEDMTNRVYQVFLTLMAQRYQSGPRGCYEPFARDLIDLIVNGLYVPCVERVTFVNQVDQRNDGLPDHAAVFVLYPDGRGSIEQVRRIDLFPQGVAAVAPGVRFKHVSWHRDPVWNRHDKRFAGDNDDVLTAYDGYVTVTADDRVVHGLETNGRGWRVPTRNAIHTVWPTLVFNAWADRKSLWQIRTTDHVIDHAATPLTLGVAEEHVKSLFYARSLPVTETGRKRPILHWVQAHARRIQAGIEVDVRKHLRGITEFDMDGLHFQIISPDKQAERDAA